MSIGKTSCLIKLAPSFILLLVLYVAVAWLSPGYDDEFFNITSIERGYAYSGLIELANSMDVHPPGQYILNNALWSLTGDWSVVRSFAACCTAISIWLLWLQVAQGTSRFTTAFAYIAICLNPALLLWGTGVRWYAYFVPVFTLLALLIMKNPRNSLKFWGWFFLLSLLLFMIGYAALILVPAGFVVALYARKDFVRKEAKVITISGLIALLLASYQLFIFFSVHIKNMSSQTFGYFQAIKGLGLHLLSNQGAIPISPFGLSLIGANLLLLGAGLAKLRKAQLDPVSGLFILGTLGLFVTKLTGKFRNLVTVSAIQGVFQTKLYEGIASKPLLIAILALFAVGSLGSIYNICMHQDTTKGSWNTPYSDVLNDIREKRGSLFCSSMLVVTHDPVIAYHTEKSGVAVINVGQPDWKEDVTDFKGCLATVQTFRGSLSRDMKTEYDNLINQLPNKNVRISFGQDNFAQFKRRFDPDIPDYYVTVTYFNPPLAH